MQACTVHIAGCNYQNNLQACLDAPLRWDVFTDWSVLVRVVCVHAHICDWNNMWPAVLLIVQGGLCLMKTTMRLRRRKRQLQLQLQLLEAQ